jgi:hypothetical protein
MGRMRLRYRLNFLTGSSLASRGAGPHQPLLVGSVSFNFFLFTLAVSVGGERPWLCSIGHFLISGSTKLPIGTRTTGHRMLSKDESHIATSSCVPIKASTCLSPLPTCWTTERRRAAAARPCERDRATTPPSAWASAASFFSRD